MMFICETKEQHFAYDIYLFVYIKIINKYKTKTISVAKYRKLQMNNTDPIKKNQG
jgi:hypothetical protein